MNSGGGIFSFINFKNHLIMNIVMHLISILTILSNGFAKIFIYYNKLNARSFTISVCVKKIRGDGYNFISPKSKIFLNLHYARFFSLYTTCHLSLHVYSCSVPCFPNSPQNLFWRRVLISCTKHKVVQIGQNPAQNLHKAPRFLLWFSCSLIINHSI